MSLLAWVKIMDPGLAAFQLDNGEQSLCTLVPSSLYHNHFLALTLGQAPLIGPKHVL